MHALTWSCFVTEELKITKQRLSKANSSWQYSVCYFSALAYLIS